MSSNRTIPSIRTLAGVKQPKRASSCGLEELFLSSADDHMPQERSVWRAVILQCLTDAMSRSAKKEADLTRREALSWLTSFSRDFRTVSEYAGYDPAYLHEKIRNLLLQHRHYLEMENSATADAIVVQFNRLAINTSPSAATAMEPCIQ